MKKLIMVAAVATFALASCKKDYVCTYKDSEGNTQTTDYPGLNKSGKSAAETTCALSGGTLSEK